MRLAGVWDAPHCRKAGSSMARVQKRSAAGAYHNPELRENPLLTRETDQSTESRGGWCSSAFGTMLLFMIGWAIAACCLGGVGVIGGAMGAHALANVLTPERLAAYETAILYLMLHAVALLAVSLFGVATSKTLTWPPRLWFAGVVLFSGSIVLLTTTPLRGFGWVTPIGGLCLIGGWVMLAVDLARS